MLIYATHFFLLLLTFYAGIDTSLIIIKKKKHTQVQIYEY